MGVFARRPADFAGGLNKPETVGDGGSPGNPPSKATPPQQGHLCSLASWAWFSWALSDSEISRGLNPARPTSPLAWKGQQALPSPPGRSPFVQKVIDLSRLKYTQRRPIKQGYRRIPAVMCSLVFMATGPLLNMKRFSCAKFRRYINRELTTAAEINVWPGMAWGDSIDWALVVDGLGRCFLPGRLGLHSAAPAPGSDPGSSRKVPPPLPQSPLLAGIQQGGDLLSCLQLFCKPLLLRDTIPFLKICSRHR